VKTPLERSARLVLRTKKQSYIIT